MSRHGLGMRHLVPALLMGAFGAVTTTIFAVVHRRRLPTQFELRQDRLPAPVADRLLGVAHDTGTGLKGAEARALFVETSHALYRLTRRVEELARTRGARSSEALLAARVLAAAPEVGTKLASLARRLETLDAALDGGDDAETARALAALERRRAGAAPGELPALERARAELEATLEGRLTAEAEREKLASGLCTMLAVARDLYRRAAGLTTADEREIAAIEAALRELGD